MFKGKTKIFSIILSVATVFNMTTTSLAVDSQEFIDVNKEAYYYTAVKDLVDKQIIFGKADGKFHPDDIVTFGEFATILARIDGFNSTQSSDSSDNHWAYDAAIYVNNKALSYDIPTGTAQLDGPINRETAVRVILRYFGLIYPTDTRLLYNPFKDLECIPLVNESYIINGYTLGIINGKTDDTFAPRDNLTRAQLCKIIYNTIEKSTDMHLEAPEPEILTGINYEFIGDYAHTYKSDLAYSLSLFEDNTVESIKDDIKVIVTDEDQSKYVQVNVAASGLYQPDRNRLVIFTGGRPQSLFSGIVSTTCHELGHYIWDELLTESEKEIITQSYKLPEDLENVCEALNRNYAKTNVYEYFAELVRGYCTVTYKLSLIESLDSEIIQILDKYIKW